MKNKADEAFGKILMIGDSCVGKTSLIECIKGGPDHLATISTTGN